jgi:hypothetical protein
MLGESRVRVEDIPRVADPTLARVVFIQDDSLTTKSSRDAKKSDLVTQAKGSVMWNFAQLRVTGIRHVPAVVHDYLTRWTEAQYLDEYLGEPFLERHTKASASSGDRTVATVREADAARRDWPQFQGISDLPNVVGTWAGKNLRPHLRLPEGGSYLNEVMTRRAAEVVLGDRPNAESRTIHPGDRAEQTVDQFDRIHFQADKERRRFILHRNVLGNIHRECRFAHTRTGSENNQFTIVQSAGHLVEIGEVRQYP